MTVDEKSISRKSKQVVIKGNLQKLSSGLLGGWQKRFFVLYADGRLCYFKKQADFDAGQEEISDVNLKYYQNISDVTLVEGSKKNVFVLTPKPMDFNYSDIREFNFSAETVTDMDMWIGSMWQIIEKYQNLKLKLNPLGQVTAESEVSAENVRIEGF
ncbi:hypothetical protein SARC_04366 [Sphaeroforma arctica JP610]|uniref:PH domain-containing protein n=1 Tax=Sphaeroforma arctica JP610 TaxID=667725 RepID=A0A0L0G3C8_9EUKA|nr:hypothetical protein SARC_04366 [Sphaeroforma arctica JP610]KNC83379.1 hypothetical protein SARC_04366 [Sphaeroforma arctica JP610]|eukprot:XP_014157281.1 hypothetical protein SARC_04366 [Sphaeroforma arctica JP610]